jgi:hypothetical protein
MRIHHIFISLVLFLFISCGKDSKPLENDPGFTPIPPGSSANPNTSSSSGGDPDISSSSDTDTTSTNPGDDPDDSNVEVSGPSDLRASIISGNSTLVLAWTDVPDYSQSDTSFYGYVIYRNTDFQGWDSIGIVPAGVQLYRDAALDGTGQYRYIYKIAGYGYDRDTHAPSLLTRYSNEASIHPLTDLAFITPIFDQAEGITMLRWAPSVWEIYWNHKGLQPEAGFVIQLLNGIIDTTVHTVVDKTPDSANVMVGDWLNLDTLGEADNHFWVRGPLAPGNYRVYAYYNDVFGNIISEFTPEMTTSEHLDYAGGIVFEAPKDVKAKMDTTNFDVSFSWKLGFNGTAAGSPYTDTIYQEIRVSRAGVSTAPTGLKESDISYIVDGNLGNFCTIAIQVRSVWTDIFGVTDYSDWSDPTGTLPGADANLAPAGNWCK